MSRKSLFRLAGLVIFGLLAPPLAQGAGPNVSSPKPAAPNLDRDPALVGWWKFDEAAGKTAADSAPQGHAGTLEGNLSFETHSAPGRSGKAIKLGGAEGIQVTGFKGVTGTRPRTLAAWIKTSASAGDIVSWGSNDAGKMWTFGHIRGRIGVTPKGGYLYMKAATQDDAWHHVAVVVQDAAPPNLHDHVKLYRDGELAEIDDIGLLDLWPIDTGGQQDVRIGRRFKGLLDDVRIYNRPLSEDEIKGLFKLETAAKP